MEGRSAAAMMGSSQIPWRPLPAALTHLGRYRLVAEIARGGIGTVYVGYADGPTGFRKLVAIKTLRPDLAAEAALVRMLIEEAQVVSRLHHPHIAQLYDLGDEGGPFLIMEYVHGESLSAMLAAAGSLPLRFGVWIAAHVCDALGYAHALRDDRGLELGLVHRDVSPQNMMIDYEGVPRLLDFGIARTRHRANDTESGVIKGRFAYMAPEQRAGGRIDGRADLHALGIVLYQATVGVHPWELAGTATDRVPDPRPTGRATRTRCGSSSERPRPISPAGSGHPETCWLRCAMSRPSWGRPSIAVTSPRYSMASSANDASPSSSSWLARPSMATPRSLHRPRPNDFASCRRPHLARSGSPTRRPRGSPSMRRPSAARDARRRAQRPHQPGESGQRGRAG